ncbi:CsbD family protein [Denitromonas sp.]|uniref:CsbD family protein n=1 Tax=Denitromonas sp. TaxID=2734609 RepID=UPI002AFFC978|nr:CsbD family protein [Denitromonas sp.]
MNKYQVQGRAEAAKGKVEEVAGKIVGNKDLEQKGKIDQVTGKAQAIAGDVKADLKNATKAS